MRLPRFTILQLLLAAALCALVLGLLTSSWRSSFYTQIQSIRFSPDGKHLAAKYTNGSIRVWRLDQGKARLALDVPAEQLWAYEYGTPLFTSNETLLDFQTAVASAQPSPSLRVIDVTTGKVTKPLQFPGGGYSGLFAASGDTAAFLSWKGSIDCYRLSDGKLVSRINVFSSGWGVSLSADGKRLLVLDQNGNVNLYDLPTGLLSWSKSAPGALAVEFAPSNQNAALAAFDPIVRKPYIEFLDLNGVPQGAPLDPNLSYITWMAFSADGSKLAAADFDAVELYDAQSKRMLKRIVLTKPQSNLDAAWGRYWFVPPSVGRNQIALSPDATTLATIRGGQLVLWDINTGRAREVIVGTQRALQVVIFTISFAVWSAAWGIVARRERQRRPRLPPKSSSLTAYMPPGRQTAPPATSIKQVVSIFVWLGATVALAVVLLSWDSLAVQPLTVLGRSLLWAVILPIGLVAVVVLYALVATRLFGPLYFQLSQLKQATRAIADVRDRKNVSGWFVGQSSLKDVFLDEYEHVVQRIEQLYGQPISRRKLEILGLDRQADYDRLFHRHVPVAGVFVPNQKPPLIVVCEEVAINCLQRPIDQLRSALALLLVHQKAGGFLPAGPSAMISIWAASGNDIRQNIEASIRRERLRLQREPDYRPQPLLLMSADQLGKLRLKSDTAEAFYPVVEVLDLYSTLAEYLFGQGADESRAERVRTWLAAARPRDNPLESFEQSVGLSCDQLLKEWQAWIISRQAELPPAPSLPKLVTIRRLENRLRLDREATTAERSRMARLLGSAGYVAGAGVLVELLDDSTCSFRGDAIWSLESISGLPLGDDAAAWRSWWGSQPVSLRQPETADPLEAVVLEPPAAVNGMTAATAAVTSPQKVQRKAPIELKVCWGLMLIGGFIALVFPITMLFLGGLVVWPTLYFSLFVGAAAFAKGAARDTLGLQKIATLQTVNIVACDPINLLFGLIAKQFLKAPRVQQYLLEANGGGL